jgi:hypothetical protein
MVLLQLINGVGHDDLQKTVIRAPPSTAGRVQPGSLKTDTAHDFADALLVPLLCGGFGRQTGELGRLMKGS